MILEPYEPHHYQEIVAWWTQHNAPVIPERWLPPFGLIARGDFGAGLAACWLYFTGTPVAYIENLVSNPKADKRIVNTAIDLVIEGCSRTAKENGCEVLIAATASVPVLSRVKRLGFNAEKQWLLTRIL